MKYGVVKLENYFFVRLPSSSSFDPQASMHGKHKLPTLYFVSSNACINMLGRGAGVGGDPNPVGLLSCIIRGPWCD